MKKFLHEIKAYSLEHKLFVFSLLSLVIILILEPEILLLFSLESVLHFKGVSTSVGNLFSSVGPLIYIGFVLWAIVHIHKINSGVKKDVSTKYPDTQTIWFWWVIITCAYTLCIFSYISQSNLNLMSRLGGILGLFVPIGPSNFVLFSVILLVVVLAVLSKMEKKTRHIEKMSARKKILYVLCVLFVLTFFVDLFGFFTAFGSYNYLIQYTIFNHDAYIDFRNLQ